MNNMLQKINVWLVILTYEDNRPEIEWYLNEDAAKSAAEECDSGEPIVKMVETFVGSNIHKQAK